MTSGQHAALAWMLIYPELPVVAGLNTSPRGAGYRIASATLRSLEARGLVRSRLGNDGDRWYQLQETVRGAHGVVCFVAELTGWEPAL